MELADEIKANVPEAEVSGCVGRRCKFKCFLHQLSIIIVQHFVFRKVMNSGGYLQAKYPPLSSTPR